ncbi:MAG: hypothetical protein ACFFCV_12830 [Promethearchaeota archaeon]
MSEPSKFKNSTLKSMLLVLGAYAFSYCLGLTLHETGHAIALAIVGASNIRIYVHPFALSHASGEPLLPEVMAFTGCMGPLFNILCSCIITLVVWRKRNPKLLPLLMCGGTALTSEGVAIFMSLAQLPLLTDWGQVIIMGGVSPIIIGIIGAIFTITGIIMLLLLFPLENISTHNSFWKLLIILSGFPLYFIISVTYVFIFDPDVLTNRLIALLTTIGLTLLFASIYKPIFPYLDRISHTDTSKFNWSTIIIAFGAAAAIISVDLIFFY